METKAQKQYFTNDLIIRATLRKKLEKEREIYRKRGHKAEIFEELGVQHGAARIDYAIINGVMCGYEIKSDRDTLDRLSDQVKEFSAVFDKLTLVVGKRHLHQAIYKIPDWWGILLAKEKNNGQVALQVIRTPRQNKQQCAKSIARLLWREEALKILEERNQAMGLRHKPREFIYTKLGDIFSDDVKSLKQRVSLTLTSREGWRSGVPLVLNGG